MIDAAGLVGIARLTAARSGSARRAWLGHLAVGAAIAAWVAASGELAVGSARWQWGAVGVLAFAMLRVPFVLFWRDDAALLSRLPIPGRALWVAALASTAQLAAQAAAAALVAAAPLLLWSTAAVALRHLALVGSLAIAAAALVPAVAVAAGALVCSGKADEVLAGLGGEVKAPPTAWLGVLPGLASAAAVLVAIDVGPWLRGGVAEVGEAPVLLGALAAASLVAAALAHRAADRVMPAMLRDVSALDRQQLATLQIERAPASVRLVGRALSPPARGLLDKHARMMARRHPMAGVVGWLCAAALVGTAAWARSALSAQVVAVACAFGYAWLVRARLGREPIELPRLRDSLPWSLAHRRDAARAYLLWWWSWAALAPAALAVARSPRPLAIAIAAAAATIALAVRPLRET